QITGIAFTVHGGTAYFDNAGLVTQTPQLGGGFETLTAWLRVQKAAKGAGLPADIVPLINVPREKRTPEQQKKLRDYFVQNAWVKGRELLASSRTELARAEAARKTIEAAMPVTYVFRDAPTPRQAYILKRGEYDQKDVMVERDVPAFLRQAKPVKTRLDLAEWVLSPENPLTARVAVNRY